MLSIVFASAKYCLNGMLTKCKCYISCKSPNLWSTTQSDRRVRQADVFMPVPLNLSFSPWQTWGIFTNMIIRRIHYSGSAEPCAAQRGKIPSLMREVISPIFVKIGEDERFRVATWYLTSDYMKGLISVFWKIALVDVVAKTTPAVPHLRLFGSVCIKDEVLFLNTLFIY